MSDAGTDMQDKAAGGYRVEQIGVAQAAGAARIRFARAEPKAIAYGVPPVEIRSSIVQLPVRYVVRMRR